LTERQILDIKRLGGIYLRQILLCLIGLAFIVSSLLVGTCFAQNTPSSQNIGAQSTRFQEKTEQEKKEFDQRKAKPPEIEIPKEKLAQPAPEAISFTLKEIKITGSTVFTQAELLPLYQSYLGTQVKFQDLQAIIEKIKTEYRKKGYFTTVVYLPEQDIKEGVVDIKVVEGRMGALQIEGSKYFSKSLIEKNFHTKKGEILNINTLQKDLLRLNQNSDLEIKAVVAPGKEEGAVDVVLKVKERFPWHLGQTFDNEGSRLSGKYRVGGYLRSTNATGHNDSIFINSIYTSLSNGESLSYRLPIDSYGTTFGLDIANFIMKIGKEFKSRDITGSTKQITPQIIKELFLSENFEGYLNTGIEIKSIENKIGSRTTASDQLRTPYFGFDFDKTDASGKTTFSPRFSFGTEDFIGASDRNHPTATRAGTGGSFFKYEQSLNRIQRMPWQSYVLLRSRLQLASHTLASSEQFQLGGENSVRGYPEGDYLADMGGTLSLDWVFPNTPLGQFIQPVVFADTGGGRLKKVLTGEKRQKFLAGLGCGLRIRLYDKVYMVLDWATAVGDEPNGGNGSSTYKMSLQAEF
jgi:hemolysin activation/secretion protein